MATRTESSLCTLLFAAGLAAALPFSAVLAQTPVPSEGGTTDAAPEPETDEVVTPRFRWVADFGRRPDGKELGSTHGCLCVDDQGRILANTDTEEAVLVLSKDGVVVGGFGKEFRGGLHGMTRKKEDGVEYLYLAHTMRGEVVKTTIDGEVLWTIGWPESSGIYAKESEYHPTAVVVADDGRIFVADGYGKSWIHVYDRERKLVKSFGGPGNDKGKFHTPHGLFLDRRSGEERLLVCDRENHRLQWFTLDGEFVRETRDGLIRPCNVAALEGGQLAVADLHGRVTILDRRDHPIAVLGDRAANEQKATNQVGRDAWKPDTFFAPHSVCADADGNLYVMDWNVHGRISKLERVRGSAAGKGGGDDGR